MEAVPGTTLTRPNAAAKRVPSAQLTRNRGELGPQIAADAVHNGNNGARNARRNQTVFNRSCGRFVFEEVSKKRLHDLGPRDFGFASRCSVAPIRCPSC
jgi:hypothetical protein